MSTPLKLRLKSAASILLGATATGFTIGLLLFLPTLIQYPTDGHLIVGATGLIVSGATYGFLTGLLLAALRAVGLTNRKITSGDSIAMKSSAIINLLILAVIIGGISSIVFVWVGLPTETLAETLNLLAHAVSVWLEISALTFVLFWIIYKLIFGIGRYIYDRFHRTTTL